MKLMLEKYEKILTAFINNHYQSFNEKSNLFKIKIDNKAECIYIYIYMKSVTDWG
jgi:hypothetical protein